MLRTLLVFQILSLMLLASSDDLYAGRKEIYNPVIDVSNVPIAESKIAVKRAINSRFNNSQIKNEQENSFQFIFAIRSHSADIEVHFTPTSIEFEFLSCVNLDCKIKGDKQLIHKNYNVWIRNLEADIILELSNPGVLESQVAANPGGSDSGNAVKIGIRDPDVLEGDTRIYVFRQKSMVGAIMTVSVGVDDKLIAQLKSSTYCEFTERAGSITVAILQANMLVDFFAVDQRPGESVFLSLDYKRATLTEIPRSRGLELLKSYKEMPILAVPKPNPAYVSTLMNPGLIDSNLMNRSDGVLSPDAEHAVITFVGDYKYKTFKTVPLGIWMEGAFLGSLKGHSLFQVKVNSGRHLFFSKYAEWSVLEAELEAGKTYYAQVKMTRGGNQPHVNLIPVKRDTGQPVIDAWMREFEQLTFDRQNLRNSMEERLATAFPFIKKTMEQVEGNLQETAVLAATDSR